MMAHTDPNCIFCKIVAGELPSYKVYESDDHLAFLSIFPNTTGVTVVIPKNHESSYVFACDQEVIDALMAVSKKVATQIEAAFPDVGRCGVVFEGFGIDHLHAKLFPLHGTVYTQEKWEAIESKYSVQKPKDFYEVYPGFISSHDGERMDDERLAEIAKKIRQA